MKKSLLLSCFMTAVSVQIAVAATPTPEKYNLATQDAAVAESHEVVKTLDAVNTNNSALVWNADKSKIKVVTWKSQDSYQNFLLPYTQTSPREDFAIWVTLAPKIQKFCKQFLEQHHKADQSALNYRLKQRLGLHPDWKYDVVVELWVDPADLFRPCVDPDPSDNTCNLDFSATAPVVKNIKDYPAFYKNTYYRSFRAAPGVPWTGLGYTYDWKNADKKPGTFEKGESEFILAPSTAYVIEKAEPTWQYCAP
jgi:hypothetical protein